MKDNIDVINLIPKFSNFYNKAAECDAQTRYELWKEHYNFAAVPPGEGREQLIRQQLDSAWEKYKEAIPALEQWSPDLENTEAYLSYIKSLLKYNDSVDAVLIFFVGTFDGNAFVAPYGENRIAVCLPVETGDIEITIVHELTHLVHTKISGLSVCWEKSIASLILFEGLATQLSRHIISDYSDEAYVEHQQGWLQQCLDDEKRILQGIIPYLEKDSPETVQRFTIGTGTTGRTREAYFVGWRLIEKMLNSGLTFSDIARIQEKDAADTIKRFIC